MYFPSQFAVNEVWIAFRLNDVPLRTDDGNELCVLGLMDAASCFLLAVLPTAFANPLSREGEPRNFLTSAWKHKQVWPKRAFIPVGESLGTLMAEMEREGIHVERVPLNCILNIVGEAKEAFLERFGGTN